jgi:hypothetical protein
MWIDSRIGWTGLTDCPTLSIQQRVADLPHSPSCLLSLSLSLSLWEILCYIIRWWSAKAWYGSKYRIWNEKKNPPNGIVGSPLENHQSYTLTCGMVFWPFFVSLIHSLGYAHHSHFCLFRQLSRIQKSQPTQQGQELSHLTLGEPAPTLVPW